MKFTELYFSASEPENITTVVENILTNDNDQAPPTSQESKQVWWENCSVLNGEAIDKYYFFLLQLEKKDEVQRKTSRDKGKAPPPPPPMQTCTDIKEKRPAPQPPPAPPMPISKSPETPPPSPAKSLTPPTWNVQDIPLPRLDSEIHERKTENAQVLNVLEIKRALECQLSKR